MSPTDLPGPRLDLLPESAPVPAEPDPAFDRFARLVRLSLGVPVSMVSLVWREGQVFPGAEGLPEPWQSQRSTPLSHSFCQYVVDRRAPLVIPDAVEAPLVKDNLAIPDLGVAAYAGYPITQADGAVVGSLCAIDTQPRAWTEDELAFLQDLAAACSSEFQLRTARQKAVQAAARAEVSAAASVQADRQSRALLVLSEALSVAATVEEVVEILHDVAQTQLGAVWAGVVLMDPERQRLYAPRLEDFPKAPRERLADFSIDEAGFPPARAVREMRPLFYEDDAQFLADFPNLATDDSFDGETSSRAFLPLELDGQPLGLLILAWDRPGEMDEAARAVMIALTRYTAQALHRAQLLRERRLVAEVLQRAMLTDLPQPERLELAARYAPAATSDAVGGDWYDALVLPDGATAVVIGDVVGHDVEAAATMGAVRNLTRAFTYDGHHTPHQAISRLDDALSRLDLTAVATMVLARIDPVDGGRSHSLTWTNAGHPAPLLLLPDGAVEAVRSVPDLMVGIDPGARRADHRRDLPPGSTLLLFTDGLIERRGRSLADGAMGLAEVLSAARDLPLPELLDHVLSTMVDAHPHDDCAVLAVRTPR